ncbi:CGNR zinc finger domain-containing protein [Streptomyces sp. LX-29]|uniref:CGNR zinc finger domain-containing protein n=1 Tax=Streptomyces sp. LX-29 TaxID=2900152 RepID=UPI00240CEA42|nr:CGNR zinc finger domain-containing protein [Streptomyces sp. LX-29]WFB08009.1 CGNR zinc finger domain-containing protein [Streptomyces sp. LX-29]
MVEHAMGLVLHSPEGVPYHFDPGALCLELLVTGGPAAFARYESLHEPADLVDWVTRSRLRPTPETVVTAADLTAARRLRDALWRLTADRAHGRAVSPADVAVVNEAAAAPPLAPVLEGDAERGWARPATGAQLLSTVARDAVELFSGPHAHRIRECGADDCYLLFVDTSRPGQRRWCSMRRCGNRHKVRALRARHHDPDGTTEGG